MNVFALADKPVTEQIAAIERGLPGSTLRKLVEAMGISQRTLTEALGFAARTMALRASRGQAFSSSESERLLRVIRTRKLAHKIFTTNNTITK
jgi:putative toxin-antitoxin system antitoxin component (TIGR02293 family)